MLIDGGMGYNMQAYGGGAQYNYAQQGYQQYQQPGQAPPLPAGAPPAAPADTAAQQKAYEEYMAQINSNPAYAEYYRKLMECVAPVVRTLTAQVLPAEPGRCWSARCAADARWRARAPSSFVRSAASATRSAPRRQGRLWSCAAAESVIAMLLVIIAVAAQRRQRPARRTWPDREPCCRRRPPALDRRPAPAALRQPRRDLAHVSGADGNGAPRSAAR